jgi:hypothetical protein
LGRLVAAARATDAAVGFITDAGVPGVMAAAAPAPPPALPCGARRVAPPGGVAGLPGAPPLLRALRAPQGLAWRAAGGVAAAAGAAAAALGAPAARAAAAGARSGVRAGAGALAAGGAATAPAPGLMLRICVRAAGKQCGCVAQPPAAAAGRVGQQHR